MKIQINTIYRTPLYKSLAKALPHKRKEILKNLKIVAEAHNKTPTMFGVAFARTELYEAFVWDDTPQGDGYWRALYIEARVRK